MSETATAERRILSGERLERYNAITARLEEVAQARRASTVAYRQVSFEDATAVEREALTAQIEALSDEEETLTAELTPLAALKEIDDMLAVKVRPYVEIAREVARVAPGEVTDVLKIVLGAVLEVCEGLTEENDRLARLRARNGKAAVDAYVANGFSREEALQLLIADRAATSALVGGAGRSRKS